MIRALGMLALVAAVPACSLDRAGVGAGGPAIDASGGSIDADRTIDAGVSLEADAARPDADQADPPDSGPADFPGARDSGPIDSGSIDSGPSDSGPIDSGPIDSGPSDSGPSDSGPIDSGPIDSGPIDSGPIDSGPSDSGPLDTGPADSSAADAGRALSCDEIFSAAPSYDRCSVTDTTCEFYVDPPTNQSCDAVCAGFGSSCVRARDNGLLSHCGLSFAVDCDDELDTLVCTCVREP